MLLKVFKTLVDLILPHRCIKCTQVLHGTFGICSTCWGKIKFISAPMCITCGMPFEFSFNQETNCGACIKEANFFDKARSLFVYNDESSILIHKLKYMDKTHIAAYFAQWLKNAFQKEIDECDIIIPVPLHRKRLNQRFFNQAALIANSLGKKCDKAVTISYLERRKHIPPQTGLSKTARESNVTGAFKIRSNVKPLLKHKKILLIDDVYTTGATVNECSKVLKRNGVAVVTVLTVARTGIL